MTGGVLDGMSFFCGRSDWIKVNICYYFTLSCPETFPRDCCIFDRPCLLLCMYNVYRRYTFPLTRRPSKLSESLVEPGEENLRCQLPTK